MKGTSNFFDKCIVCRTEIHPFSVRLIVLDGTRSVCMRCEDAYIEEDHVSETKKEN